MEEIPLVSSNKHTEKNPLSKLDGAKTALFGEYV